MVKPDLDKIIGEKLFPDIDKIVSKQKLRNLGNDVGISDTLLSQMSRSAFARGWRPMTIVNMIKITLATKNYSIIKKICSLVGGSFYLPKKGSNGHALKAIWLKVKELFNECDLLYYNIDIEESRISFFERIEELISELLTVKECNENQLELF